jgi:hypothetical protein
MSKGAKALTGPRQMVKQFEMASMAWQGGAGGNWQPSGLAAVGSYANWQAVPTPGSCAFYNEGYLDLSGYTMTDLTTVISSCRVQDPGVYLFQGADQVFCVYDIISMERLSAEDLNTLGENNRANRQMGPGMPEGPLDRDQVIFGLYRFFAHNTTNVGLPELMINSRTARFGSGEPTAVEKLWTYRIVIFFDTPANGLEVTIPAANFVVNANIIEESEIPYMFRLKKSFELATGN